MQEFEAENFQCVDVILSVRVEGVVEFALTSLRSHRRTSTGEVSLVDTELRRLRL